MPTYISLVNYTNEGIAEIENSPDRLDAVKELAESIGGSVTEFYLTMGQYDIVVVGEFPDDETYAQFALAVAREGAVSTETLKAFPEDEYRDIIDGLAAMGGPTGGIGGHTS